jgi:hypothetical protein
MNAKPQQASHDEDSEIDYSDSHYSSDSDTTAEDGDHQHTTTSNEHPRTYEIVTENPDILTQDDSDTDNSLEQILLSLRKTMNDEILKAAGMAKSMYDEAYQQSLDEASDRVNRLANRKEYYKNESRKLEEERKSLIEYHKNESRKLEEERESLREEVDNLKAGMDAARKRAMGLFE